MKKRRLWKQSKQPILRNGKKAPFPPAWRNPMLFPFTDLEPESEQAIELEMESVQEIEVESEQILDPELDPLACMTTAQLRNFFANNPAGSFVEVNYLGYNGTVLKTACGFISQFDGFELVLTPTEAGYPIVRIPANIICSIN
ncbi:hypothetical protein ACQCT6_09685 [Cytobacillus gottheilii]